MKHDEFVAALTEALVADGKAKVDGLGTFRVRRRAARTIRHPQTGETATIAPSAVVVFEPTSTFAANLGAQSPQPEAPSAG